LTDHPLLKIWEQQKNISEQIALEKAKMLPGLQLAYNLNSFKGMGADDKVYNATPQFHSCRWGFVPIFRWTESRIEAAKVAQSVAESELKNAEFNLQNQLKKANQIYQTNLEIVSL
jgi:cobalt-zinc-cadmium resistance protein CzcA